MSTVSAKLVVVGMFLDVPPPGSVYDRCDACGETIILGPESQRIIRDNEDVVKGCMPCVLVSQAEHGPPAAVRVAKDYR